MEGKGISKDLLKLEHKDLSSSSGIGSALLVCKGKKKKREEAPSKPTIAPLPRSQFLDKVKGFLGVMAEANKRLEKEAAEGNSEAFDIETLTGEESQVIEMDLMLGVADLNTPEAVHAAEAAIAGNGLASKDSSSDDESDDSDSDSGGEDESSKKRTKIIELS